MKVEADKNLLLMEAYRLSEKRLEVQQSFAVAADQRSLVLAGVAIAAAAFVSNVTVPADFMPYGKISAFFFAICALVAILSAAPQSMHSVGALFSDILPTLEADVEFKDAVRNLAENNEQCFVTNETKRQRNSTLYYFGISMFGFGVVIFGIFQIIRIMPL